MNQANKKVEVKDPAVKELQEDRSCLRRSCTKGCFFIVVLFVIFLGILKFTASSHIKTVEKIPNNFPQEVPIYDEDNIEKIILSSENNNSFLSKSAKIIPKFLIVSTYLALGKNSPKELENYLQISNKVQKQGKISQFMYLMKTPTKEQKDRIKIYWKNLQADPDYLSDFYITNLENKGFSVNKSKEDINKTRITFNKDNVVGNVYIEDKNTQQNTHKMILTVIIPPNKND